MVQCPICRTGRLRAGQAALHRRSDPDDPGSLDRPRSVARRVRSPGPGGTDRLHPGPTGSSPHRPVTPRRPPSRRARPRTPPAAAAIARAGAPVRGGSAVRHRPRRLHPLHGSAGFSLGLEGGYGFDLGPVIVTPVIGLQGNWGGDFTVYTGLGGLRVTLPLGTFGPFVEGGHRVRPRERARSTTRPGARLARRARASSSSSAPTSPSASASATTRSSTPRTRAGPSPRSSSWRSEGWGRRFRKVLQRT